MRCVGNVFVQEVAGRDNVVLVEVELVVIFGEYIRTLLRKKCTGKSISQSCLVEGI